jgi:hypothetical protein
MTEPLKETSSLHGDAASYDGGAPWLDSPGLDEPTAVLIEPPRSSLLAGDEKLEENDEAFVGDLLRCLIELLRPS